MLPGPLPESVLLITDRYPPHAGGLARSSQRLARHAFAEGIRVHVLVTRSEGAPGSVSSACEEGIWVHRLGVCRDPASLGQAAFRAAEWLHVRERFQLLHGQYASTCGFLAVYWAPQLGAASYVSLRGNDLDRDAYDPGRFAQLEWALRHTGGVGAVSRALVDAASRFSGRDDIRYTPNSVDGDVFRPTPPDLELRAELGLAAGPVLGFTGELRHKKGMSFLLETVRSLADLEAQLLLVGTVRPAERQELDAFLEGEPELQARVRLCPYLHEPARLRAVYALMDVALFPSLWEGMPNSVLEALACGRPVIASDAGGIPDSIASGEHGWVISRHELHRLPDATREVLALSPGEREAVGRRGRKRMLRDFCPAREGRELLDAYVAAVHVFTGARPRPRS